MCMEMSTRSNKIGQEDGTIYQVSTTKKYEWNIVWRNVIVLFFIYTMFIYGMFLIFVYVKWSTFFFTMMYGAFSSIGVTCGSHRLWSHRSYKANLPLRIILAIAHSAAFQNSIYEWARDHRMHHKYSDTDADPHNASRGLFFSHVGWLMLKKHKEILEKGKTICIDDVKNDPVVAFQHRYRFRFFLVLAFIIPTLIPWYFFNESFWYSFCAQCGRYGFVINSIMTVNSFAHYWGTRPYDKNILPTDDQPFKYFVGGEGWHNYHHVFPWDYRASEFSHGGYGTSFIWLMSKIGWATQLKTAPDYLIRKRMLRTGDGTVTKTLSRESYTRK